MRQRLHIAVVVLVVVLAGCGASSSGGGGGAQQAAGGQGGAQQAAGGQGGNIGLSAGGAQDANAFRTNVREGIEQFRDYFASEMAAIGDDSMQRDLEVLDRLRDRPTVSTTPVTEGRQQNFDPAPRNDGGGGLFGAVSIVDLLSLGATVVIGGYGLKKRNRGQ